MWQVIHGDCLEVLPTLGKVDCVLTDPPYGMAYRSSRRTESERFSAVDGDDKFDATAQYAWIAALLRVLADNGAVYSFASDHHLGDFRVAFGACGFTVKRTLVWVKDAWTSGDLEGDYGHSTEFVVYATKGRHILNGRRVSNVMNVARVPPNDLTHPCEKPVALLRRLLRKSAEPGMTILDPFCGSGSTGVAALQEGMNFIGIEKEAKYVEIARRRIGAEAAQGKLGFA